MFVASAGIGLANLFWDGNMVVGPLFMIGSVVAFVIGLIRIGKQWSTIGEVSPFVSDYNQRLIEQLRNDSN